MVAEQPQPITILTETVSDQNPPQVTIGNRKMECSLNQTWWQSSRSRSLPPYFFLVCLFFCLVIVKRHEDKVPIILLIIDLCFYGLLA
jgi:hypothetical protein